MHTKSIHWTHVLVKTIQLFKRSLFIGVVPRSETYWVVEASRVHVLCSLLTPFDDALAHINLRETNLRLHLKRNRETDGRKSVVWPSLERFCLRHHLFSLQPSHTRGSTPSDLISARPFFSPCHFDDERLCDCFHGKLDFKIEETRKPWQTRKSHLSLYLRPFAPRPKLLSWRHDRRHRCHQDPSRFGCSIQTPSFPPLTLLATTMLPLPRELLQQLTLWRVR